MVAVRRLPKQLNTMTNTNNNYCVILAGGKGRRLWPCSRDQHPKQFVDFFGTGRTQLQQTYDRFARIMPREHIIVSTNEVYAGLAREQLPELGESCLISEPVHRNTAPSVAWAVCRVLRDCPDANIIVSPSDVAVFNEEAFVSNVAEALDFVDHEERMMVLGVKPTRPEPGYGYVQLGDAADVSDVYKVKSFTEKPEREFARMFMENGEFYWNTGVFISNGEYMRHSLDCLFGQLSDKVDLSFNVASSAEELDYISQNFASYPNVSIDCAVLEKTANVYVMVSDFGWADLGTWHSMYEALAKDADDNVAVDSDVMFEDSHNNIVKMPKGRTAVISGLRGYIVAEHGNVLFICPKEDSSARVRKFVNEMLVKRGEDFV